MAEVPASAGISTRDAGATWSVYLLRVLVLTAAYFLTGRLGLLLAVPPGYATAIFPASGIALAFLLIHGPRYSPGILLGSFSMNLSITLAAGQPFSPEELLLPLSIATGAMMQGLVGYWLVRRFVADPLALTGEGDILRFMLLAGPVGCLISASNGVASLVFTGNLPWHGALQSWWYWWVGDIIGVVLTVPFMFALFSGRRDAWQGRRLSVIVPILITFVLVIVVFFRASAWETERLENLFRERAQEAEVRLRERLFRGEAALNALAAFYAASQRVDPAEFRIFTRRLLDDVPVLRAIEWVPRVPGEHLAAFERQTSTSTGMEFKVHEGGGALHSATRDWYYPVTLVEPLGGNMRALGYDLGSNPVRLQALQEAAVQGVAVATGRIQLVQEQDPDAGSAFLLLVPVYDRDIQSLKTGTERFAALEGYATGVLRLDDIVQATLGRQRLLGLELRDFSVGADGGLLYRSEAEPEQGVVGHLDSRFSFGGRDWGLRLWPRPDFYQRFPALQSWLVLAAGLLFTGLLGTFLLMLTGRAARTESMVRRRTEELRRTSHSLQRNNDLLRMISRIQEDFIADGDTRSVFDRLLDSLLELTGSEYGFIGEVLTDRDGRLYLKTHAITNIAWNEETSGFYEEQAPGGMEFLNLNTLFGEVLTSGKPVISNHPDRDSRGGGLPEGHPPLNTFCGIPFHHGERLIGMVGLANRPQGYDESFLLMLQPVMTTCGSIIEALRTERRREQADAALRDSESRIRAILDNAYEGIITVDEEQRVESANPAAERLFGYARGDMEGVPVDTLLPAGRAARIPADSSGGPREMEGCRRDGETVPVEVSFSEVSLGDRRLLVGAVHDLTERRKVDRLKGEFISTVSHELRTPLTSIRGSLGLLQGGALGELPGKAGELVQMANENAVRLSMLINDLLDFEKLEYGGLEMQLVNCPLQPLLERAVSVNRGFAQRFDVRVVLCDLPAETLWVRVSEQRLLQVLTNLLSNAIKFSPADEQVEVSLERMAPDRVRISVRDHGPGIADEFRERIFERFAQADASSTRSHPGTGLGLYIARSMVEKMGGSIGFTTRRDAGTTFYFELPLVSPAE